MKSEKEKVYLPIDEPVMNDPETVPIYFISTEPMRYSPLQRRKTNIQRLLRVFQKRKAGEMIIKNI